MSSSSSTVTQDKLRRKLAWTRPLWLAVLRALHKAYTPITAIEERDPKSFELNPYLKRLEGAEFYEIVYQAGNTPKGHQTANDILEGLDEDLRNGALTFRFCQKGTYVFWDMISNILKGMYCSVATSASKYITDQYSGDKDLLDCKLRWMRKRIQPQRVFVPSDSKEGVKNYAHDYIQIVCEGNERFVWDPSGDQFGLPDWLYSAKDYREYIEKEYPDPIVGTAEHEKAVLDNEEPQLKLLKAAVEKLTAEVEADCKTKGLKLTDLSNDELEKFFRNLATKIEQRIIELLVE
jgi:hypothetical protein